MQNQLEWLKKIKENISKNKNLFILWVIVLILGIFVNLIATFIGMMVIKVLLLIFSISREIIKNKKKNEGGEESGS